MLYLSKFLVSVVSVFVIMSSRAHAFVVVSPVSPVVMLQRQDAASQGSLYMSADIEDTNSLGATERLLLEAKQRQDDGIVQEFGRTVMNDSLDPLRAVVWGLFGASQYVFGALAVALVAGLALNMAGYGYYFDANGLHLDSLVNIQRNNLMEIEMSRLAASVASSGKDYYL